MSTKQLHTWCVVLSCFAAVGCGDDTTSSGGTAGILGGTAGTHAGTSGGSGTSGTGTSGSTGGEAAPTARVRVVNLVPGVTFDAWGPDADAKPTQLATDIAYAEASDYFDAPINRFTMYPIFVLWKQGEVPPEGMLFSQLLDDSHTRVRIEVREIDGEGERATIILEPQDPVDVDPTAHLEYETLDETELNRGDATQLNLHISYHLFDLGGGVVDAFAIEGEACFHDGSTSVAQVWSVPVGSSALAVYDRQTGVGCSETEPLATLPLAGAAGENLLISVYVEDGTVKMLSAPIE